MAPTSGGEPPRNGESLNPTGFKSLLVHSFSLRSKEWTRRSLRSLAERRAARALLAARYSVPAGPLRSPNGAPCAPFGLVHQGLRPWTPKLCRRRHNTP